MSSRIGVAGGHGASTRRRGRLAVLTAVAAGLVLLLAGSGPMTAPAGPGPARPGGGLASGPEAFATHELAQDPEELGRYWTARRRAGAVDRTVRARPPAGGAPAQVPGQPGPGLLPPPAEPGGAAGGPTGAEGSAGRVALAGGEVTPYRDGGLISRVSGALFATIAGIDFSCSAAVVDSPGGDLLVTAGHCLHEHGEFATNVIFIPGYQNGAAPYGVWRARRMTVTASWAREQDFDQDAGFVAVGADGGRRLADVVGGSLDIAFGPRLDPQVVFGYPKLPPFDGTTLMSCGGVPFPDPHGGPSIGLRCPMTAGASGGPWLARFGGGTGVVDSVVSYSYASDPSVIYGTSFGPVIERLYRHATQL